ncbi:MAG: deoxyribonuclease IV [Pseudoflavonifractor sp.]|nr:deoxyribonuclease IV [Alloprevotella sp.]MCM1116771.1 deoxyribonuclease IV [Pseudoflavonifractor sp.]
MKQNDTLSGPQRAAATGKYIGAHVAASPGVSNTPLAALEIGAGAFALFTRNPSRWASKAISDKEAQAFRDRCAEAGYTPDAILPHDSFLINLGAPDPEKLAKSREAFADELARCEQLGLTMLNFHPGSHLNILEPNACLDLIAESINIALEGSSGVKAVIENTAGQGSNLGFSFAQLARIIDSIADKSRVGVCIDSCHAFAAGYDLACDDGYKRMWEEFDNLIGLSYLSGMHLNDSKKGLGSHVDRHAPIGQGEIGIPFFKRLIADPLTNGIPLILETPDETLWPAEIDLLYSFATPS